MKFPFAKNALKWYRITIKNQEYGNSWRKTPLEAIYFTEKKTDVESFLK